MHEIRQMIGVCPQQDVLFDLLSVKEHLQFFAAVKVEFCLFIHLFIPCRINSTQFNYTRGILIDFLIKLNGYWLTTRLLITAHCNLETASLCIVLPEFMMIIRTLIDYAGNIKLRTGAW